MCFSSLPDHAKQKVDNCNGYRAMLCKRGLCCHAMSVCLSVCLSVCVSHVRTFCQNFIFEIFLLSGSHTILVFPYQTAWRYSDGNSLNGGVECRWGRQKSRFWSYIWLHCLLLTLQQARCCQYHLSLVVSGGVDSGKRRRNIYDKKSQRYATDKNSAFNCTQW